MPILAFIRDRAAVNVVTLVRGDDVGVMAPTTVFVFVIRSSTAGSHNLTVATKRGNVVLTDAAPQCAELR